MSDMKVPFVDLARSIAPDRAAIDAAIAGVIDSQRFIQGPDVAAFESELSSYLGGDRICVGVSNGSDALVMALMALGIGPGDEVIVPAYTFAATATSVVLTGATPVFVDVVEDGLHLDPAGVSAALTERTRAVLAVHLFGRPADWSALRACLAGHDDVHLVEDAAQAIGATFGLGEDAVKVGALGHIACFSFFPAKNLGCFGDGGLIATDDESRAETLKAIRVHGRTAPYHHSMMGVNGRLDTLQAAILRVRLKRLDEWVAARRANAAAYRAALEPLAVGGHLGLPDDDGDGRFGHSYNQFNLRVGQGRRDALREHLRRAGVATAVYYPAPLPYQPCFGDGARPGDFPVSDRLSTESLAIPVFPGLTEAERTYVIDELHAFFRQ